MAAPVETGPQKSPADLKKEASIFDVNFSGKAFFTQPTRTSEARTFTRNNELLTGFDNVLVFGDEPLHIGNGSGDFAVKVEADRDYKEMDDVRYSSPQLHCLDDGQLDGWTTERLLDDTFSSRQYGFHIQGSGVAELAHHAQADFLSCSKVHISFEIYTSDVQFHFLFPVRFD